MLKKIRAALWLTGTLGIVRRYLVVNGFDGALTMLGLVVGFYLSGTTNLEIVITACMGAAVALAVSGFSSAYISESAEKQKELRELEQAMIKDLGESVHGRASRLLPVIVATVNGLSPFLISLLIISPIWLARTSFGLPWPPLETSFVVALTALFGLGVYLGAISRVNWIWAGIRALLIALVTSAMIIGLNYV
jgi:predicted membrane protein (TIGR00267 family)